MQQQPGINEKWLLPVSLLFFLAGVAAYVFTGTTLLLFAPLALFYIVLAGIDWRTAYWLMLFCIPLSSQIGFLNDTLSTSLPDEPMMWVLFLLFLVFVSYRPTIIPAWWFADPLVWVVILQYLWLIVAVCSSKVLFLSVKFLIAKSWMLACFFVFPLWIFKEKKDYIKAAALFFIPLLLTMIWATCKHAQDHFTFPTVNRAVAAFYDNHVDYSTVISMFFPFLLVVYPFLKDKPKWIRLLLVLLVLFFLVVILLTYARAAVLAVIFSLVIAAAIRLRLVNFVMPVFYGLIALLMVYMVRYNKFIDFKPNYERTYMHTDFADHLIATFRGQDMSSMERLYRWIAAVRMSRDEPVTGYGPHAFYYYYKPYTLTLFKTYVSQNPEHSTTHNYFLYMLVEQGWPAMILYAILVVLIFAQAQKIYHRFKDPFYKAVTIALAMSFAACFINNFFSELLENHKIGAMFYLTLALLVILNRKSKNRELDVSG